MAERWYYSDASYCKVGSMVCTHCKKKIAEGEFRYRETPDEYLPQHRDCSESDPNWAKMDAEKAEALKVHVPTSPAEVAKIIKEAFFEGFDSYASPCVPYSLPDDEWEDSEAKRVYDELMKNGES